MSNSPKESTATAAEGLDAMAGLPQTISPTLVQETILNQGGNLTREETFYIEEYKLLKEEIRTKLLASRQFSKWGLVALAALYSYIFAEAAANVATAWLVWVPVLLSFAMLAELNDVHGLVEKTATYIRGQTEAWIAGTYARPAGWETFLKRLDPDAPPSPLPVYREPLSTWFAKVWKHLYRKPVSDWYPTPIWLYLLVVTFVVAIVTDLGVLVVTFFLLARRFL